MSSRMTVQRSLIAMKKKIRSKILMIFMNNNEFFMKIMIFLCTLSNILKAISSLCFDKRFSRLIVAITNSFKNFYYFVLLLLFGVFSVSKKTHVFSEEDKINIPLLQIYYYKDVKKLSIYPFDIKNWAKDDCF